MNQEFNFKFVFKIFIFLFFSWFLVHFFSVFGLFLAVAYPIWWLFSPTNTICFYCRSVKEGEKCPFCKEKVVKGKIYPKRPLSAVINGLLVLIFSLFSISMIFVEVKILNMLGIPGVQKTVSFVIPDKSIYKLGEIFPMRIEITGIKTSINAVQADLGFDKDALEMIDFSTEGSFANIFVQKDINNESGYARLTGGVPNPGFVGDRGLFAIAYFRGKIPGVTEVEFLPSSMVLANDGRGSNVLKSFNSMAYMILPEKVTTQESKNQTMIFETDVLGQKADETQMIFYDEKSVLGLDTEIGREGLKETNNIFDILFSILEVFDRYVLGFWVKILNFENTTIFQQ